MLMVLQSAAAPGGVQGLIADLLPLMLPLMLLSPLPPLPHVCRG